MKNQKALERLSALESEAKELRKELEKDNRPITERITNWTEAINEYISKHNGFFPKDIFVGTQDEIAYKQLKIIVAVLNEDWTPNWSDSEEYKYYNWFKYSASGFDFADTYATYGASGTGVGSRLFFKNEVLAKYAAIQFKEIYNQFLNN